MLWFGWLLCSTVHSNNMLPLVIVIHKVYNHYLGYINPIKPFVLTWQPSLTTNPHTATLRSMNTATPSSANLLWPDLLHSFDPHTSSRTGGAHGHLAGSPEDTCGHWTHLTPESDSPRPTTTTINVSWLPEPQPGTVAWHLYNYSYHVLCY